MEVARYSELTPRDRADAQRTLQANAVDLDLEKESALPHARIWVSRLEGQSVGCVLVVWAVADELQIMQVATRPEFKRKGLADSLLRTLVNHARQQRSRWLLLEVRQSNSPAIKLYEKHGFRQTRVRRNYYSRPSEDGIDMALELAP